MYLRSAMFLLPLLLCMSSVMRADDAISDELMAVYRKEKRLDGAAFELFLALREKYGMRLRVAGQLVYCHEDRTAAIVQPVITDLILDADEMLDELNLKLYEIENLGRKERMELIRRAVTGTTVYMFSANDHGELIEKLLIDQKEKFCDGAKWTAVQIIEESKK